MRTLVLNKSYMPIRHVSWKEAFRLTCKGRAIVVETYEEIVRTPSDFYFIPAVIRLDTYDKLPKAKVTFSKRTILERDNYRCQYCSKPLTANTVTIDHVIPRSRGGQTTFENTVASCFRCNNRKGSRLNHEAGLKLDKKPVKPTHLEYKCMFGGEIAREWVDYLPRKMLDGVSIID